MADAFLQSFRETFGAGVIGALLAMGLYGLTTLQTYFYFVEYPKDKIWKKTLVWTLWVLNTLHSALMCHVIYHFLILSAFNPLELSQNVWSLPASMLAHVLTAFLVMLYFLNIIFQFSTPKLRWWLVIPNATAIFLHIGFGTESIVDIFRTPTLVDFNAYTKISFLPMAVTQVGADVMLAASLCFVLYDHRTAFRRTNSMVDTLMIYAVNRCLLTAGLAIASLLMITLKPKSLIYIAPEFICAGLYTNALMASLNSRQRVRDRWSGEGNASDFTSVHLSNVRSDTLAVATDSRSSHHDRFAPRNLKVVDPVTLYDGIHSVDEFKREAV
ncbi:hypothetical protein C8R44DRAFT_802792 [Mycena epipterygia]|nr:hypothetical protein C8R44DRAFT_802792 [Mycena epipterygia]